MVRGSEGKGNCCRARTVLGVGKSPQISLRRLKSPENSVNSQRGPVSSPTGEILSWVSSCSKIEYEGI